MRLGAALATMTRGVGMVHQRVPQVYVDGRWERDESREVEVTPIGNPLVATGLLREAPEARVGAEHARLRGLQEMALAGLEVPDRIVSGLREGLGGDLVAVVLFGSRARGDEIEGSDWDFLVVARNLPERTLERAFRLKKMLPPLYRGEASLLAKTPKEFVAGLPDLYLDIALDGVILHNTDGDMTERLEFLRTLIRRKGLRREKEGRDLIWRWDQPPGPDWSLEWEEAP